MAVWLPATNKFYLPPAPITRIQNTDEYVSRTDIFYHAGTERLLTVGHPFYEILSADKSSVEVPKVSGNQYRVFRFRLPDPNNFAFGNKQIFDPEKERLVWALRGIEIQRGQPLGVPLTGHTYFNKLVDAENTFAYDNSHGTDQNARENVAFDPKQVQLFLVGCRPQIGEYWDKGKSCDELPAGNCPPLELVNATIQDGDMTDIGFGALNFQELQDNKSDVPFDLVNTKSIYPDFIKMAEDSFGDSLFFYARREQMYVRHMFLRDGMNGEPVPDTHFLKYKSDGARVPMGTSNYGSTPSGSLVSSESQIFNRPYWLQRSQGQNNGIIWLNDLFVTVADNTRGTVFNINKDTESVEEWSPQKNKEYLRHVEEFQFSFIIQLCKVQLTPENLAFIHTMDPQIVDNWHLSVNPPPGSAIEDHYRYINSLATRCPDAVPPAERQDPYKDLKFWEVDLTERLTEQLDQTPLGRKFLFQIGAPSRNVGRSVVTRRTRAASRSTTTAKRRRKTSASRSS